MAFLKAPELRTTQWFNSDPLTLEALRGTPVVLYAFQMLCPGCVQRGTPLMQRIHQLFAGPDLTVIALHTVFEHHEAMTPVSLAAYLHEFRLRMPVAVDEPTAGGMPATMTAYAMEGTPSWYLIDREGYVRHHHFGVPDELALGAAIADLVRGTTFS